MQDENNNSPAVGSDDQPPHVDQAAQQNAQTAPVVPPVPPVASAGSDDQPPHAATKPPVASAQGDGDPGDETEEKPRQSAHIDSIAPENGLAGTTVTIRGGGFGNKRGAVSFNSLDAPVESWTPEEIVCRVPDLPLERGGHNLRVEMDVQVRTVGNGWCRSVKRFRQE